MLPSPCLPHPDRFRKFGTEANEPSAEFHIPLRLEALLMHGSDGVIEVPVVVIIASVCLQELAGANLPEWLFGREPLYSLLRNARVDHAVLGYFAFNHLEGIRPKVLLRHD